MSERDKLIDVTLDEDSLAPPSTNAEHERRVAMFDLLESNSFAVEGEDRGPYRLALSMDNGRLRLLVQDEAGADVAAHPLSLTPLRRLIKDYFMVCESYYAAIRDASPSRIEAIDMGRRSLHNDSAEALAKALEGKIKVDFETARRLFTLISALHVRG